jgi:hypothetical protein
MRAVLLSVIATAGLVGCVGGIDMPPGQQPPPGSEPGTNPSPVPPAQSMAKQMFDQNVWPIISAQNSAGTSGCAGTGGCHNTSGATPTMFLAANAADGYATATSYQSLVGNFTTASAGIITKIEGATAHNGRSYSAAEKQKITDWLAQEVIERNGTGTGSGSGSTTESPGQATARLLNQWSACMTEANWTTAGMTTAWGNMQTNNGSKCESCHATGGQGMIATEIQDTGPSGLGMWTVVSQNEYYMVQFFTVDLTQTPAKVMINHVSFDGVANATPPHTEHPTFNSTTNNGMTALQKFYDLTTTAVTAGNCGAPKLSPPAS